MSEIKTCSKCKIEKTFDEFYKNKTKAHGLCSECKSCTKMMVKNYSIKNRDKKLKYLRQWQDLNREKHKVGMKIYQQKNLGKFRFYNAFRKATKLRATPKWLTDAHLKEIENIYIKCQNISKQTNIKHEVDHIIPLQGKNVSGLHVPWNLQIITAKENHQKGNRCE